MKAQYKTYTKRSMAYSILTDMVKAVKEVFSKKKKNKKKNSKKFY